MSNRVGKAVRKLAGALALAAAFCAPVTLAHANAATDIERAFDSTFGTEARAPREYDSAFEARIAAMANAAQGRIGVAAMDLATGHTIQVLGDQRFPMASTSKVAIAATYMEGVEKKRWTLQSEFPLLIPVRSAPHSSAVAPVTKGQYMSAASLIELMLTRSSNTATDALLAAVGGPRAVNDWARRAGIRDFHIDRDIATLVRDDGAVDPAVVIEDRDSATPLAMIELLSGLYEGKWLKDSSNRFILSTMERCRTGTRRIRALLPGDATVAHKTGSLYNTSSDIGIVKTPDGRAFAVAIYVTGQGSRLNRESRIANLARAIYDGYAASPAQYNRTASR